uniref:Nesprin-2 n=1 Tax=Ornithorhynchus anatinus TaxID=9258 RepID=A0A6I8NCE0_ORNAN
MALSYTASAEDEQISSGIDDLHFSLQAEQEHTQKKTFTCWINSQLAKHVPPSAISDLYTDIKKGHVLLDLLEVLSGQQLTREKGTNPFQCRSNIEQVLVFLKNRSIKLINIHVTDIIEGNPSIVLGLIWTIILHFHIEELAWTLSCSYNQPSLDCVTVVDLSPTSSPPAKRRSKAQARWKMSAKKALLLWAREQCAPHCTVSITDFKSSWRNGMAFLAVIHALRPDLIDMNIVKDRSNRENLNEAFRIAECELSIPRLLEPEDVDVLHPDEKSIMTYVAQFLQYSKDLPVAEDEGKVKDAIVWLTLQEEKLKKLSVDSESETYYKKYQDMHSFLETFNEEKKAFLSVLSLKKNMVGMTDDQLHLREAWDRLTDQINEWRAKLDHILPSPLDRVEAWLQEVEHLMAEDLPAFQDYSNAMTFVEEKLHLLKGLMDNFDCHLNTLLAFENKDQKHMPLIPPDKLEEMKRRFNDVKGTDFIALLEFHYYLGSVQGLIDEVKSKLHFWNIKYGTKESVELLLQDWHNFIEKRDVPAQLDASFQKCEEMNKNLGGDPQNISKQFKIVASQISACRKYIYKVKSTLQKVLSSWDTYTKNLHFLKFSLEESKKEHPKEISSAILASWNSAHGNLNEAGNFLMEVSNDQVGLSIAKDLKKLNRRWAKFIKKTQFELKLQPVNKEQKQLLDNNGNTELCREEKLSIPSESIDLSTEVLKRHIRDLKIKEENEGEIKESSSLLRRVEEVEKLINQVENWEAETRPILNLLQHQPSMEGSTEESLQHLIAKGSACRDHISMAEDILQTVTHGVSRQGSLQHFHTTGLQAQIEEAKDKIQTTVTELEAVVRKAEPSASEKEIRVRFEESRKELESCITKALKLLGSKASCEDPASEHKEALSILDSKSFDKFLEAAAQQKSISPAHAKLAVEEQSRELCEKWKAVSQEIVSYICILKVEIEKGKLNEILSKLEKQINKEEKCISKGRTKGLAKQHEACFLAGGRLGQLDQHLTALRSLCPVLPSEKSQQEARNVIAEFEKRKAKLQKSIAEISLVLPSLVGGSKTPKSREVVTTAENGDKEAGTSVPLANQNESRSTEEASEATRDVRLKAEPKLQYGESSTAKPKKDSDLSLRKLLKSYDTQRERLELHFQTGKTRIVSAFPSDSERGISCLQDKMKDLQVLKDETDSCWREFEIASSKVENLLDDAEKLIISRTYDRLKREEKEFQITLSMRMKSLEIALGIVLPIEKEAALLCDSDQLSGKEIQEFNLTNIDAIYQSLQDIQSSLAKQIELCSNLELPDSQRAKEFNPIDLHATHSIILKYKKQFEEMTQKLQSCGDALRALEDFLALLRTTKLSIEHATDGSASNVTALQENTSVIEAVWKEIPQMEEVAKGLDERLKTLGICFKDADNGEDASCVNLAVALSKMAAEAKDPSELIERAHRRQLLEAFLAKNNELLKNIQDVQDQINTIGLKDSTIPAVSHRIKSLTELEKKLNDFGREIEYLWEMAEALPQLKTDKGEMPNQLCRATECFWDNVKSSVVECLEQCERIMELLKQYQSCKSVLTTLIQKKESIVSQQASYMGKENLQRRIATIEMVREEFNEHSQDVDRINQICKNLQYQLNKMKTYEEPPFEKEANIIVDRWLDVNEKTENYYENLGRALALWEKLLNLSSVIDEWTQKELVHVEVHGCPEEEVARLKVELEAQEQNIAEFDSKVTEIQHLLQSSEPPLELQVTKSFILHKIEEIKAFLAKINTCSLSGSPAELKEDLDQAKNQIGMTESLLKALSPSDSLEIFTKLEEIQQQIFQQKHSMILLENQIGCLTPELAELKKQYESVSDLFKTKKSILQDHFSNLLNDQCKSFNDWLSSTKVSLVECFEPSETKKSMEDKLQKLTDFLTFEGRGSTMQQVETVLNQAKRHLPKANVSQLNGWIVNQETELQRMDSLCQARIKELHDYLQQLVRLQEDSKSLNKWLTTQEEKWKETKESKKQPEIFYRALKRQRDSFDALAQLTNSLEKSGLTSEETVTEGTRLVSRYQALLSRLSDQQGECELLSVVDQNFEDLAQETFSWITEIKESLIALNSTEGTMPLEERIQKIKEITLLKPEGDAKIQNIIVLSERSKLAMVQETILDLENQWDRTIHLANKYLSHQEKLRLEGDKYLQSKEDLKLMLTELKKQQEAGFALQHGLQEKKAQLKKFKKFLQKAEDLTSLLNELKAQGNYLLECTKNHNFSEEPWLEIKHLHESLLLQLQESVKKSEGHVQEHQLYQDLITDLRTTLKRFNEGLCRITDVPIDKMAAENTVLKIQEQEEALCQKGITLEKILSLAQSVKQNTSSVGKKMITDETESLKVRYRELESRLQFVKQEAADRLNDILQSKSELPSRDKEATALHEQKPVGPAVCASVPGASGVGKLTPDWVVSKDLEADILTEQQSLVHMGSKSNTLEKDSTEMFNSEDLLEVQEQLNILLGDCDLYKSQLKLSAPNLVGDQTESVSKVAQDLPKRDQLPCTNVEEIVPVLDEEQNLSLEMISLEQLFPDAEASMESIEDEQKVTKLQNQAFELNTLCAKEQLKELEKLYTKLKEKRAAILPLEQHVSSQYASASEPSNAKYAASQMDKLLHTLSALKDDKHRQYILIKNFKKHLSAVKASIKALSAEKETLKTGTQDHKLYQKKMERCLDSIQKEGDSLCRLKMEQENVSGYLTEMDKKFSESQVRHLEHCWEHVEQVVQKKYSQLVAEDDEFKFLMNKARDIERLLQRLQRCAELGSTSPEGQEENEGLLSLATELQVTKHRISLLKGRTEHELKRIWGEEEKETLENTINALQKQLEAMETPRPEVAGQTEKWEIMTAGGEVVVWVKSSLASLDQGVTLLPEDVLSQARKHQTVHAEILGKWPAIEALVEEAGVVAPRLSEQEAANMSFYLKELQDLYQLLVFKSTQRSQLLESKLEERERLFSEIKRIQSFLQENEILILPDIRTTFTKDKLEHQYVTLKSSHEKLTKIKGVILTYLQENPFSQKDQNIFEQIFLCDQLRSLKNRADRTQRLIQNKYHDVRKMLNVYNELLEQATLFQQELIKVHCDELRLDKEGILRTNQEVKDIFSVLKERLFVLQTHVSQVLKHKELFECVGLSWDTSQLSELQTQLLKIESELEENFRKSDRLAAEHDQYQASLSEILVLTSQLKSETAALASQPESPPKHGFQAAQTLDRRVEKTQFLTQAAENQLKTSEVFEESFKRKELKRIKSLSKDHKWMHRFLQDMALGFQPKYINEKDFLSKLDDSFHELMQIKSQVQHPLLVDLDLKCIQDERNYYETLQEKVQVEVCIINALTGEEKQKQEENSGEPNSWETKYKELENLQIQLMRDIASSLNNLNDSYDIVKAFEENVQKAVGIVTAFEASVHSHKIDLDTIEESKWKPEEFESAVADIQELACKLENRIKPRAKLQLQYTLSQLTSKRAAVRAAAEVQREHVDRCLEIYAHYNKETQKVCINFNEAAKLLHQSMTHVPLSYKEALEHLEQTKGLVLNLLSMEETLMGLRQDLKHLNPLCTEKSNLCLLKMVSALWEKWLSFLEIATEWEMSCEELKQEWKFVSEEIEREAIIVDNLQEELPESTKAKEKATKEELSESLEYLWHFEESLDRQQLLLTLLLQRQKSVLNVPAVLELIETVPAVQEIRSMQDRCNKLYQKVQKNKELVQTEVRERDSISKEIIALKNLFQNTVNSFHEMEMQDQTEEAQQFEEIQRIITKEKLTLENIMEKLRIKYSEMYCIVPAEIETQVEECKKALERVEEKVRNKILESSPPFMMNRKIEDINNGLRNAEKMLQQKSKNIEEAQEVQKKIWDELDLWHSKLNELDSEVQDLVEQDPGQAQEWMDNLMVPRQQYQQVSQRAEYRTSQLNKATLKMEEYNELLKGTEIWIDKTSCLLADPVDYDSSKALSQHATKLQMALEDSEQKQNLLHSIYSELEQLSVILETKDVAQLPNQLSDQVSTLQQEIMGRLPQLQDMADEVTAIELEVKSMEKKFAKIKSILLSKDIFDFSPKEHLKHGEVILDNIHPMKKTIGEIKSYGTIVKFPGAGTKPLPVFERTNQLLQDVKVLEKVTQEQNEQLKMTIIQTDECDQEIENLKLLLKNYSSESLPEETITSPQGQGGIHEVEEQILKLNQKKEDLLMGLKSSLQELHRHLHLEPEEGDSEVPAAVTATEESGGAARGVCEWKVKRKGSMSLLPSVVEEVEESSLKSENGEKKGGPGPGSLSLRRMREPDQEDDRASASSETLIEGAPPTSLKASVQDQESRPGALESPEEAAGPEPADLLLQVCRQQVAELELWLDRAKRSFAAETRNPEMQQLVEQQLAGCQAMLTEIEHKVTSLLENCKDQDQGDGRGLQQEAEALSLKLKAVKCNLEKVQVMLQDKYSINQILELKPSEQKDLIRFIEFNAEKLWHQQNQEENNTTQKPAESLQVPDSRKEPRDLLWTPAGQSGDKWQNLQPELSSKMKLPFPQLGEPQVPLKMNILPRISVYNVRSPIIEELKTYTVQLEDLSQEANDIQAQDTLVGDGSLNLEKKLFDLLLAIICCLSNMEEMLRASSLPSEDAVLQQAHFEALSSELRNLQADVRDKKDELLKTVTRSGKRSDVFCECFDHLQTQLQLTQAAATSQSQMIKAGLDQNSHYQNEIRLLCDQLTEKKSTLQRSLKQISGQSVGEQLQIMDACALELQNYERQVAKLKDEGEKHCLPDVLIQEVYKLEDGLDDLWGVVRAEHPDLKSPFNLESQAEGLLRGLGEFMVIAREKLAHDQRLQTRSKVALQTQLQSHKKFFQKLIADMLLMETHFNRAPHFVLQKPELLWAEQVKEVTLLEQQAHQRGTQLESLLQEWEEFDENNASLEKDLEALASSLPSVSLVEETEERLMERIALYQQIKRSIDEKHAQLYQTVNEGKQLVSAVGCSALESQIAKLEEQWLSLTQKVDHELHRLQTLLKHLVSYNQNSGALIKWLESAQQTLNYWKEQSLNVSQDLETIRENINRFFDFTKEVDEKSSLKTSVISTGNQLLHLKETDTATLRASLAQFEQKWAMLITQLPDIQEKLHQLQMEKLPSQRAITETMTWMKNVEGHMEDETDVDSQSTVSQVKNLLQKYKEFRMEMNYKQWIVDFVNQSLLQLSTCDVESKRYERTEFAEQLGEMNRQWHRLHGTLNKKIQYLEQFLENITENENKMQTLSSWMEAQGERLKTLQKPASIISVQKTLLDCQELENQLAAKAKSLNELRESYEVLDRGRGAVLRDSVSQVAGLYQMRSELLSQVTALKAYMQSVLQHWRVYDKLYKEVNVVTIQFWYCVEHSKSDVISLEALRRQVKNLQVLQEEAERSEGSWDRLQEAVVQLKDCCPSFSKIVEQKFQGARSRWTLVNHEVAEQLQWAQALSQLWESYVTSLTEAMAKLQLQEEKYNQLLAVKTSESNTAEILTQKLQDVKELQQDLQSTREAFLQNSTLVDQLLQRAGPTAQGVLSHHSYSLQRISYLEKMLLIKSNEFEFVLSQLRDFKDRLESLEGHIKDPVKSLDQLSLQGEGENPEPTLNHMLALTALSPDIEYLNRESFKLPLSDVTVKTLHNLNRQWAQATAAAVEQCSEVQGIQSKEKKFLQKYEKWVEFVEKMEETLKMNIAGRPEDLLEQQKIFEMLQGEISVNQHIASSVTIQSLHLLEAAQIENRTEFISKLTMLKEMWQSVTLRAQQRKNDIDGLVKQWQGFNTLLKNLMRFLNGTIHFLTAIKSQDCYRLCEIISLIHDLKNKEIIFQRMQIPYSLTLTAGEQLLNTSDPETKNSLKMKIKLLQDEWKTTRLQLEEELKRLRNIVETWDRCEKQIKELGSRLQILKEKIKAPLPEQHDELYKDKELIKELETSLSTWAPNLQEVRTPKAALARLLLEEDVLACEEQIERLHGQWEELCNRVSLRKQEVEDRLNTWALFSEKNTELCAWLVQMENKVLQTADISIEEMIEKLQKDCVEEINLFSENKLHLKQMGEQLLKASSAARVTEIDDKLNKMNDRWQHLFDVIGSRVKKLKETFAFIQQLDRNMSSLRTWLARVESELSKPVVYDICDDQEIQRRLAEQQDLQRDIEQHSAGVESVFSLCDILLHDPDACANETECDSIQQTTRSLDRRWRNICAMSMERRLKIEETWRLWQKFLDDCSRFEDWLQSAERTSALPNSSEVLYTNAKEELKKFEAFQRQIHERLTQLELINKQYRRLARENRTDSASKLKQRVHEGNRRWDGLQKRVAAILRRLRHFTNQREEFEGTRESILVWLTEMDLQLTNVEHFSASDAVEKMRQLNGFQQEITLNTNKIDQLIVFGEQLIQKSEPMDAVVIEDELEELHRYCQEVFGRVSRFYRRLTFRHPGLLGEKETSENETEVEDSREMQSGPWHKKAAGEGPSSQQSLCHLVPPPPGPERSGCETPVSVDSIPLEWDHTGDVGGSSSHEDDEEGQYFSALSGKSISEGPTWHSPESPPCRKHRCKQTEGDRSVRLDTPDTSTPFKPGYVQQLVPTSVDSGAGGKEGPGQMNSPEQQDDETGLGQLVDADQQTGTFDQWELIQAQDLQNKLRLKRNLKQWNRLNSELQVVTAWLKKAEGELEEFQKSEPATSLQEIERQVKKLKDILKAFAGYKASLISVNLSSEEFQQGESSESKELHNRLRQLNLHWEKTSRAADSWREGLRRSLMECQDFHRSSQNLLLWLAEAEKRHCLAQISDPHADPHALLESQKEFMELEKELSERQLQVNALQEISAFLLVKGDGEEYIEADEKIHVIQQKLKRLLEKVSQDLKSTQGLLGGAEGTLEGKVKKDSRVERSCEPGPGSAQRRSFLCRVIRAALPVQVLFLLLLLLACMVPSSEEDYSCTQANNFARSFYPMLS